PREGYAADSAFLAEAFRGADGVFVMIPPDLEARDPRAHQRRIASSLADGLKKAGARRAVALSSVGASLPAGTGPIAGLHELEETLKSVPDLSVAVLRPAYFMENHLGSIRLIKTAGINGGPVKSGVSFPMVATRDVAA